MEAKKVLADAKASETLTLEELEDSKEGAFSSKDKYNALLL